MNKIPSTILIVLVVLLLAGGLFFAGNMYARTNALGPGSMMFHHGWGNNSAYRQNMMNGHGGGIMNGYRYNNDNLTPLTVDQAKAAAGKYLANLGDSDLEISEVMIFDNNAYIAVKEASTGNGAFELLADASSQVAYPEYGPNMMWNIKYGGINHSNMMGGHGGMMGGWSYQDTTPADISAEMTVTPEKAIELAQKYLDVAISDATAADDPIRFYGYYTLDYEIDGKVVGMLSVNGFSGDVFLHTWHGDFVEESAVE